MCSGSLLVHTRRAGGCGLSKYLGQLQQLSGQGQAGALEQQRAELRLCAKVLCEVYRHVQHLRRCLPEALFAYNKTVEHSIVYSLYSAVQEIKIV